MEITDQHTVALLVLLAVAGFLAIPDHLTTLEGIRDQLARIEGFRLDNPALVAGAFFARGRQRIDNQLAVTEFLQLPPQQRCLVVSSLPQTLAMKRHRHDDPIFSRPGLRNARSDQARQHRGKRDPAPMLQREDQLSRRLSV